MTWANYPENTPIESGYYMTFYFNPEINENLYKALWFSVEIGKWTGPWRWNYEYGEEILTADGNLIRPIKWKGIDVKKYQPSSKAQYYTQCEYIEE